MYNSRVPSEYGLVAQLGERSVRIREVEGSNPFRSTIKDCTFVYHDKSAVFSHFRTKQVKNAVNQAKMGFGAVNETAPKPIFYFRSRKIAKKSAVLFVSLSSVKTYRLRGSERI